MSKNNLSNIYDDDNIPEIDLPRNSSKSNNTNYYKNQTNNRSSKYDNVEPLPESTRPRKDGPGGD